mgnify:CR=1 FL=1
MTHQSRPSPGRDPTKATDLVPHHAPGLPAGLYRTKRNQELRLVHDDPRSSKARLGRAVRNNIGPVRVRHPESWRRRRLRVPADVVLHHYGDIAPEERSWMGPVPATSVGRTLSDCAKSGLSPDLLRQAAHQALCRGARSTPAPLRPEKPATVAEASTSSVSRIARTQVLQHAAGTRPCAVGTTSLIRRRSGSIRVRNAFAVRPRRPARRTVPRARSRR